MKTTQKRDHENRPVVARKQQNDRVLLKNALIGLLDDIPIDRLRALYIKALVAQKG